MPLPPHIFCGPLPTFDKTDWRAICHAFEGAASQALGQAWLTEPEAGFMPAVVKVGWREQSLLVLAELTDSDIFTHAARSNEKLWELGDVFEIFLRPAEQQSYFEFHVAPSNLTLQLRFPNAAAVAQVRKTESIDDLLIHDAVFQSRTWVQSEARRWFVFAEIPVATVSEQNKSLPGSRWFFSFCRYDYSAGSTTPIISSTSAHTKPDFHRQDEWGAMLFQSGG
jgi:hypothetical protein